MTSTDPVILADAARLVEINLFSNMPQHLTKEDQLVWFQAERAKLIARIIERGGDYVLEESKAHIVHCLGRTEEAWTEWWAQHEAEQRRIARVVDSDPPEVCPECGQAVHD